MREQVVLRESADRLDDLPKVVGHLRPGIPDEREGILHRLPPVKRNESAGVELRLGDFERERAESDSFGEQLNDRRVVVRK